MKRINTKELINSGKELNIIVQELNESDARDYIKSIVDRFKPSRKEEHLSIGKDNVFLPLENNEFCYSKLLEDEAGYIFFCQSGPDRNSVVRIESVKRVCELMSNSFGMEYFVSNKVGNYLIAVNWYIIEVAGVAQKNFR